MWTITTRQKQETHCYKNSTSTTAFDNKLTKTSFANRLSVFGGYPSRKVGNALPFSQQLVFLVQI